MRWPKHDLNLKFTSFVCFAISLAFANLNFSFSARAGENGRSNYVPGYYGDYAVAIAPKPGFYIYSTAYSYFGKLESKDGASKVALDGVANLSGFQYVFAATRLGLTFAMAAYTSVLDARVELQTTTPFGPFEIVDEESGHGDTSFSPLVVYGKFADISWSISQSIFVPTGSYSELKAANVSRNYFSLDSVLSVTWLNPSRGIEVSLVPGLMYNFENPATKYKTGLEFHLDGMINFYLSDTFAVGLHSYVYTQLEDDRTNDIHLGNLRGSSAAIGPSLMWVPKQFGLQGKLVGKWLHEFYADERFQGDIVSLTAAFKF